MIKQLNHSNHRLASQIRTLFQTSYKVEATLIGVADFPPLSRTTVNIMNAKTCFYGFFAYNCLAAVIEIELTEKHADIHSLTVDPAFFRKGIAGQLMSYVLTAIDIHSATVETAIANKPAIHLYEKHGFVECRSWTPSHGIKKVEMSYKSSKMN